MCLCFPLSCIWPRFGGQIHGAKVTLATVLHTSNSMFCANISKDKQISPIQSFKCFQDKQRQQQQKTIHAQFASKGKFDQIRAIKKKLCLEKSANI